MPRARLREHVLKEFVGKIGAEYIESGLDLWFGEGRRKSRAQRLRLRGALAQRRRQGADQRRVVRGGLDLEAKEAARRRTAAMHLGRFTLGFAGHQEPFSTNQFPVISGHVRELSSDGH